MSFVLRSIKETIKEDRKYGKGGNKTEAEGGMKIEDKERKRKEKESETSRQRLLGSEVSSLVVGQQL